MTVKIIRPKKVLSLDDIKELWVYKELLFFFAWRDLKVRYKQTVVGILWALFQPLTTMVVFSVFFGRLAHMPSDNIPYPIFVYTGLIFWQFFSTALADTGDCLIANQAIITKVYFPRLILPLAATAVKFVDFFIALVILFGMMVYYGYVPQWEIIFVLPILLIITLCASIGLGLLLASINVKYRDVRYVLPFFIQLLLFFTPVIYPSSIAGKYAWVLSLNPMTGVIDAARASFLGNADINWPLLAISGATCLIVFCVGVAVFKKTERYFADLI